MMSSKVPLLPNRLYDKRSELKDRMLFSYDGIPRKKKMNK